MIAVALRIGRIISVMRRINLHMGWWIMDMIKTLETKRIHAGDDCCLPPPLNLRRPFYNAGATHIVTQTRQLNSVRSRYAAAEVRRLRM